MRRRPNRINTSIHLAGVPRVISSPSPSFTLRLSHPISLLLRIPISASRAASTGMRSFFMLPWRKSRLVMSRPTLSRCSRYFASNHAPGRVSRLATQVASKLFSCSWGTARPRSDPRAFPSHGFDMEDDNYLIDEERIPEYQPSFFYPVHLGHVYDGRYQTVTKLGWGSCSTIWLARDLQ